MKTEFTFDELWLKSKRVWLISTAIAIIGFILVLLGNSFVEMPKNITIALILISVVALLYSLWLVACYMSGFIWGVASSINPIITIIAIVIFPLLIIPLFIGWYAEERINNG